MNQPSPATSSADPSAGPGIISAHHGVAVEVRFADGARRLVRVKRRSGHVVGDAVRVAGEVLERLPRRTELRRRDALGAVHLVAANLDVLGIVVSPAPPPPAGFVDQAIVAARAADLAPFLVINKCDLAAAEPFVADLRSAYAGAVELFPLSAATGAGLEALRAFFAAGHRGAFVGATGVGKSSLLNALCPEIDLQVGELNEYSGKGRNTTTVSTLHSLAGGGELIDTPGFNDFGLVEISAQELSLYFPGFEQVEAGSCRFRDCRHRSEPGCAVQALVSAGQISADRYTTYLTILDAVEADGAQNRYRGKKG